MSETKKNDSGMAKLTLTLFAICAVCALVLGLVNNITASHIAAVQKAKDDAAMGEIMAAETYTPLDYTGSDATVQGIVKADDTGYVVTVAPSSSFSGTLTIMVSVNNDLTVGGVAITKSGETSGLGAEAQKPAFRDQFKGLSGEIKVTKDGGVIEAITGATITSRAVCDAVNSAMTAVADLV